MLFIYFTKPKCWKLSHGRYHSEPSWLFTAFVLKKKSLDEVFLFFRWDKSLKVLALINEMSCSSLSEMAAFFSFIMIMQSEQY